MTDTSQTVQAPQPTAALPRMGRVGLWFAAAAGLSLVSSILLRAVSMPWGLRFAVALLPAPAVVGIVLAVRRQSGSLDELERRVQLEAMATAFGVAAVAFIAFSQLQVAGMLGPEDWVMPWLAIWAGYIFGFHSARRRYS